MHAVWLYVPADKADMCCPIFNRLISLSIAVVVRRDVEVRDFE